MVLCVHCGQDIPVKEMTHHVERHHDVSSHVCPDCGKVYDSIGQLKDHQRLHLTWTCDTCGKEMAKRSKNRHLKNGNCQVEAKVKIFCCHEQGCGYMTDRKGSLVRHRNAKHVTSLCDDCGQVFTKPSLLEAHRKKEHVAKAPRRRYKCGYCVYQSTREWTVKQHEKKYCAAKRRTVPPEQGPMPKKARIEAFLKAKTSVSSFKEAEQIYQSWFGKHWFEPGSTYIEDFYSEWGDKHKWEDVWFTGSDGNPVQRSMSYVSDLPGFLQDCVNGRQVKNPRFVISADAGLLPDIINN